MQSSFATARQRLSELGIDGDKERAGTGATGIARVTYLCGSVLAVCMCQSLLIVWHQQCVRGGRGRSRANDQGQTIRASW